MRKYRKSASLALMGFIAVPVVFPCVDDHNQYCELHERNPHGMERSFADFEVISLSRSSMTSSASVSFSVHPSLSQIMDDVE